MPAAVAMAEVRHDQAVGRIQSGRKVDYGLLSGRLRCWIAVEVVSGF